MVGIPTFVDNKGEPLEPTNVMNGCEFLFMYKALI